MAVPMASTSPVVPSAYDSELARESSRRLGRVLSNEAVSVRVSTQERTDTTLTLPAPALQLLMRILTEMAEGNAVTLVPHHAELTTQQAADMLNVSRPHLIKLLEEEFIPFHRVGTHRRILFSDVMSYKKAIDERREATLRDLAVVSQELSLDKADSEQ